MAEDTGSKKRKLDDAGIMSHGDEAEVVITRRCETLWFEDGNIILVADGIGFKLYKGILTRHSPLFNSMFTLPQPNDSPTVDGCMVVIVHDPPDELEEFLLALYDSSASYFSNDKTLKFNTVKAMLSLGSKYDVDHIREEAIRRLRQCFPDELDSYVTPHTCYKIRKEGPEHYYLRSSVNGRLEDCIAAILLANEHHLDHLLPAAFYACAQLDNQTLIEGYLDDRSVRWQLSPQDLNRVLEGQRILRNRDIRAYQCLLDGTRVEPKDVGKACRHPGDMCISYMISSYVDLFEKFYTRHHALLDSDRLENKLSNWDLFCSACKKDVKTVFNGHRRTTWESLRTIFDVEVPAAAAETSAIAAGGGE
ncbi:hypothetical protein EIP91_000492 [Steccherinum ochraceum]|uniref:BTB domain-containing protein n=1 Tax=Steccherinum ochraceum TaxID=92696 RepID=A0A4R0S335_9APHY|nr:hypothetical protein EIP91_000492 [Steccherinum ochraceum]